MLLALALVNVLAPVSATQTVLRSAGALDWYFVGHGAGPGVGMGQWGALGDAVRYHWGYRRMLAHFYGGTRAGTLAHLGLGQDPWISVLVVQNLDLATNHGDDTVVTSSGAMRIESGPRPPVAPLPEASPAAAAWVKGRAGRGSITVRAGAAIDLHLERNGTWEAFEGGSCAEASAAVGRRAVPIARGLEDPVVLPLGPNVAAPRSAAPTGASAPAGASAGSRRAASSSEALTVCAHGGARLEVDGDVEAYDRSGYERTVAVMPLESYVAAVVSAELPAGWASIGAPGPAGRPFGFQALEAQAVAVRSFAVADGLSGGWNGYATICNIWICQAYAGSAGVVPAVQAAASATAGQVRLSGTARGRVVATPYSASSGGYTAPGSFPAVADPGDVCVDPDLAAACNPFHTWRVAVPTAALSRDLGGLGRLRRLKVDRRDGDGAWDGRVLLVTVVGAAGTRTLTGNAFAAAAGLPSDWFARVGPARAQPKRPAKSRRGVLAKVVPAVSPSSSARVVDSPDQPSLAVRTAST